jgi:hypothetical protein
MPACIDPQFLRKLLEYAPETGILTWRPRMLEMFNSKAACQRWNAQYAGKVAISVDSGKGYKTGSILGKSLKAHRVAWAIYYGEWPLGHIDHVNGIKCDNRIANLRAVTRTENMRNLPKYATNTSGVCGIHWYKPSSKWCVSIHVDTGKRKNLGYFANFEDAVSVRKDAERKYGYHENHGRNVNA